MITMGLVFIPKIIEVIREGNERSDRSSAPDGGTTKEEEERYQKLISENEQLQKILEQKEHKLKQLRQKLEERNAATSALDSAPGSITIIAPTKTEQEVAKITVDSMKGAPNGTDNDGNRVGLKNNNVEHIEVLETCYTEPSDSAIGHGLSVHTRTPTEFELSESYL